MRQAVVDGIAGYLADEDADVYNITDAAVREDALTAALNLTALAAAAVTALAAATARSPKESCGQCWALRLPSTTRGRDWIGQVREATGGGATLVYDGAGGPPGTATLEAVADGGLFVTYGTADGFADPDPESAARRRIRVLAPLMDGPMDQETARELLDLALKRAAQDGCDHPVPRGATIDAVAGHMHLLGRAISVELNPGQPDARTLLNIPQYNFDDQAIYPLAEPVTVKPGDRLRVTCTYDVGLRKQLPKLKPLPPRYVVWGDGTSDEMCLGLVIAVPAGG